MSPSATLDIEFVQETETPSIPDEWIKLTSYDPSFDEFIDARFARLQSLTTGWDGRHAVPLDMMVLAAARELLTALRPYIPARPAIVPLANGSVQFEWHDGAKVLELEMEDTNTIHYLRWNPRTQTEDEGFLATNDLEGARSLIAWFIQPDK